MTFTVLKLRISGTVGAYKVLAQLGDKTAEEKLGDLPENFRDKLAPLQQSILRTTNSLRSRLSSPGKPQGLNPAVLLKPDNVRGDGGLVTRGITGDFVAGADVKSIQEIGEKLFDCLFQQDVYALYKQSLAAVQAVAGASLPIKLLVEPSELAFVPWETLFDKKGNFHICCYGTTPFARTATMQEEDLHIYDQPPIKVLGMISAPKSFSGTPHELNTDAEQKALTEALRSYAEQVQLRWTTAGTYRELRRQMVKGCDGKRWDVFLFIGHGLEGQIVLEEDGGSGYEFLDIKALKGLLTLPLGPKLVILNSCRGAQVKDSDRFASTAESLVKGGSIAAVVAMQFDISDVMGTAFSPAFFETLTLEIPVQQAMVLTRLELQHRGFSEWISPVLYMQNKDGLVMRPTSTSA
ncbi:MAG: hypothetical protein QOD09_2482 [Bradyrhizobium sp.]|nr:hypothetical protein [Bradyrhizobium sp.]MEA2950703.1 hypothetical protein [Alphaproteobacteria bacterium]